MKTPQWKAEQRNLLGPYDGVVQNVSEIHLHEDEISDGRQEGKGQKFFQITQQETPALHLHLADDVYDEAGDAG